MANLKMGLNPDTLFNDLIIEQGTLQWVEGLEEVGQEVWYAYSTILGEWFFNLADGFPWKQVVLTKPVDPRQVQDALVFQAYEIDSVIDVLTIPTLEFEPETRTMTIENLYLRTTAGNYSGVIELEAP